MWACSNDVNVLDVVTGVVPDITNEQLRQRVASQCDLRNGLADIREFLPNAKIIVNEYHRITSNLSDFDRSGCGLQQGIPAFSALAGAAVAFFATDALVDLSGERSTIFRDSATSALSASASALNEVSVFEDPLGRGSIEFLDHPFFDPPNTAIWASNSLLFPLVCNDSGLFAAIDPMRTPRVAVCARLFETSTVNPFRIAVADRGLMQCVRAAGFHPNARANELMAIRIMLQRQRFYPRMLNFSALSPAMVNPNGPIP